MKKSLIALLVATLPAAAFADVTIYGKIKGGAEYVDNGVTKQTNIDDLGSRIGFKGGEDLGNGLKAIWQVETGFGIDGQSRTGSSSGTFANRESFVGFQSGFGTVRLGNVSNFLDSDMGTVDAWEYSNNALGLGIFTRDATRLKNSIRYDLPAVVPGLTAAFQYGTKENKGVTSALNSNGDAVAQDRETYNLGLGYEYAGFFGKYNYSHETALVNETLAGAASKTKPNDKHRLEVGYNANNLYVGLGMQYNKGDMNATVLGAFDNDVVNAQKLRSDNVEYKSTEYALTAAYTIGAFTPKFTYAQAKDYKAGGNTVDQTGYKQYVLGVDYALSKRTKLGAQYGEVKFDDNLAVLANNGEDKVKAFGLNVVHAF
nr:porin [Chromobacterium sp. ASV5]